MGMFSAARLPQPSGPEVRAASWMLVAMIVAISSGCTAMTNPIADGIPVRLLPPELWGPSKAHMHAIPLDLLSQPQPDVHRLSGGDVLGVFIDGFLGERALGVPLHTAPLIEVREQHRLPPSAGYPVPVQEDGSIALPSVPKLSVQGMTVAEARQAIRNLYVNKELIRPDNERIIVTLLQPRQTQVLVLRQEAATFQIGPDGAPVPSSKRNTGHLVDLPAYQNDVMHALVKTGGLPDFDVYNEIIIARSGQRDQNKLAILQELARTQPGGNLTLSGPLVSETIRVPLRLSAGAPLPFAEKDILLRNGDILFLEARDEQVFFTAGLLPPGKHALPRDQDLDVLEAIAQVRGPLYNGAFGGSNLAGNLIAPGLGSPSPSLLVVVRRVPGHGQVHIAVDLRSAVRYPQERLRLQPGDVLILQETPTEALTRYVSQTFLNFNIFWSVFTSRNSAGVLDVAAPDRLPGRVGTLDILRQ
jgi:protein involved in polysaccharide export with SLBB domain